MGRAMIPEDAVKVLDKGYVRCVSVLGSDLTVANSARVSYNKQKFEMDEKDVRLIKFLAEHDHTSPFRHAVLQFEVYAPLMVARQWWKHCIGSNHQDPFTAWNESSRRYVTEDEEFYIPIEWRKAADNKKQGSEGRLDSVQEMIWTDTLRTFIEESERLYENALANGICAEQARLFLPAYSLYVRWYWTVSLHGTLHFIDLRSHLGAQKEIRDYSDAVESFVKDKFPVSWEAWNGVK